MDDRESGRFSFTVEVLFNALMWFSLKVTDSTWSEWSCVKIKQWIRCFFRSCPTWFLRWDLATRNAREQEKTIMSNCPVKYSALLTVLSLICKLILCMKRLKRSLRHINLQQHSNERNSELPPDVDLCLHLHSFNPNKGHRSHTCWF